MQSEVRFSPKEYKPMSLEDRIGKLESERYELSSKRTPLVERKQEIEFELSKYKNQVRQGRLPQSEYEMICKWNDALNGEKRAVEKKLMGLKVELAKINTEIDETKRKYKKEPNGISVDELIELRDKYMQFASDTTRVSSMRAMSSKFVEEIQAILKLLK